MPVGLSDIYEKLKELVTITDKVRENTDRITRLEEKVDNGFKKIDDDFKKVDDKFKNVVEEIHTLRIDMVEMRGDIKAILSQLKTEERIDALESAEEEAREMSRGWGNRGI